MEPELTPVPMDATDRENIALALRGEHDSLWLMSLAARYDLARSMADVIRRRSSRADIFMCDPDESGGLAEVHEIR